MFKKKKISCFSDIASYNSYCFAILTEISRILPVISMWFCSGDLMEQISNLVHRHLDKLIVSDDVWCVWIFFFFCSFRIQICEYLWLILMLILIFLSWCEKKLWYIYASIGCNSSKLGQLYAAAPTRPVCYTNSFY